MLLQTAAAYFAGLFAGPRWLAAALVPCLLRRHRPWVDGNVLLPVLLAAALGSLDRTPRVPPVPHEPAPVRGVGWIAGAPEANAWGTSASLALDSLSGDTSTLTGPGARFRGTAVRLTTRGRLPPYGTRVEVHGTLRAGRPARNFGASSEAAWLAASGTIGVLAADSLRILAGTGGPAWRRELLEPARARLAATIAAVLAPREAGLLQALAVGRRDGVDPDVAAAWSAVGVTHILSISGMHVALVAGAVLAICGPPHRRKGAGALLVVVWGYAALGGLGPTVLRATLMASWAASAIYLGRTRRPLLGLGVASLVLLFQAPARRTDLGLQLSCLATGGLLLASPALARFAVRLGARGKCGRAAAWAVAAVGVGLAAQTATLPLQFARFGTLSWCAPAANLVLVPLTDLALALGLVGAPLHLVSQHLGRPLLLVSGLLLHLSLRLPLFVTEHLRTCLFPRVDRWTIGLALAFALAGFAALLLSEGGRRTRARVSLGLAAVAGLGLAILGARPAAPRWRFEALDVGQGDAFVLTIGDRVWVVDAGDVRPVDAGARVVVPHLRRLGVRRVCGLVLTHLHGDHAGGAPSVLANITADTLYTSGASGDDSALVRLRMVFPAVPVRRLAAGDSLCLGSGTTATVLWPAADVGRRPGENARSLALWTHGGGLPELFLMGDLEAPEESVLVARWRAQLGAPHGQVRFLKAGHHGSATSSSTQFLGAISPALAIVSVGAHNRFGHPALRTLTAFSMAGIPVLRTDRGGAIRITLRDRLLWCERPARAPQLLFGGGLVDAPLRPP